MALIGQHQLMPAGFRQLVGGVRKIESAYGGGSLGLMIGNRGHNLECAWTDPSNLQ